MLEKQEGSGLVNDGAKVSLSSDFMLYKEEGPPAEYFLFNVHTGSVFQLNVTAYDFLLLCNGKLTGAEILLELSRLYSKDECVLQKDFVSLVAEWEEKKIVFGI